jgi:hypothetical protein
MVSPTLAGQALVDSFDSIRIINLVDRRDRRVEMAEQLARLGLGLDHPRIALFEACRFSEAGGFPTAGTRGCFQSHLDLLREAEALGLESILILEDDFNFHDEIETLLPAALAALGRGEWDIFHGSLLPDQYAASTSPIELIPSSADLCGCHFYALRGPAIGQAAAYLEAMTHRPAGQAHPDGDPMHYDGGLSHYRKRHPDIRTFVAFPDLGHQRLSRTDIHALPFYDRIPGLRQVAALARGAIKRSGRTRPLRR